MSKSQSEFLSLKKLCRALHSDTFYYTVLMTQLIRLQIQCWTLTDYSKCVFLDADTLLVQNSDELFDREEFSAAPDAGWPDCFNSGVFVFRPDLNTFRELVKHAMASGSFDGGDQGLLNTFYSSWATRDISRHLPFTYNMVASATYSYLPAYKHFGHNVKIVHFIGECCLFYLLTICIYYCHVIIA